MSRQSSCQMCVRRAVLELVVTCDGHHEVSRRLCEADGDRMRDEIAEGTLRCAQCTPHPVTRRLPPMRLKFQRRLTDG
jgi:hypothetical protein